MQCEITYTIICEISVLQGVDLPTPGRPNMSSRTFTCGDHRGLSLCVRPKRSQAESKREQRIGCSVRHREMESNRQMRGDPTDTTGQNA